MMDQILDIKPPHLSVYSLILEEKTYFGYLARQGKLLLPDEDLERNLVHYVTERLKNAGYNHYELSNFALPGYEAIHNSFYWERIPYLGLGLGAASHWEELRWKNSDSLQRYLKLAGTEELCNAPGPSHSPIEAQEVLRALHRHPEASQVIPVEPPHAARRQDAFGGRHPDAGDPQEHLVVRSVGIHGKEVDMP